MTLTTWTNKQIWRVTQTYVVLRPFFNVVQLILWGVIAIGVNEWFSLTWENFAIIMVLAFLTFNLVGYILDRKGFFLEHKVREFKITSPILWISQMRYNAALLATFIRLSDEELEEIIATSTKDLEL